MANAKLLLSPADVREETGICLTNVLKMARSGEMPFLKIGKRFLMPREVLNEWLIRKAHEKANISI